VGNNKDDKEEEQMTQNWSHLLLLAQELHRHLRKSGEREKEGLPSIENGGTQEKAENITIDTIRRRKNLIHPMVHIKRLIIDSSDLQIMRVSSQTVAFR
jgi:hypothetical protein